MIDSAAPDLDEALRLFEALLASPGDRIRILAAVRRALRARAVVVGTRNDATFTVHEASGSGWPAPGARLSLARPVEGLELVASSPSGDGRAVLVASDHGRSRPSWFGEPERVAVREALLEPATVDASDAAEGAALERLAAIVAEGRGGLVLEFAIAGTAALEARAGRTAARAVVADLERRLRALVRRDDVLFAVGPARFVCVTGDERSDEDVAAFVRRIEGIIGFPHTVGSERYVLAVRVRSAPQADLRAWATGDRTASGIAAVLRPPADDGVPPLRSSYGYLVAFDPIYDGGGIMRGAEALVRRVHPRYGVLAPERLETVASDEAERLEVAHWLSAEAAAVAVAVQRGLGPFCVNICSLTPASVESFVESERFGEYCMKGLRFELTARQVESVPARLDAMSRAEIAVSFDTSFATEAVMRGRARVREIALDSATFADARPATRSAFRTLIASAARSLDATLRVRGAVGGDERVGVDAFQPGESALSADEIVRFVKRAGASA